MRAACARTLEILDQRGVVDRFLAQGQAAQVAGIAWFRLDISDFPTRHNYGLALLADALTTRFGPPAAGHHGTSRR